MMNKVSVKNVHTAKNVQAAKAARKPFFLWSCILHVSILLILILEISFSGNSAPSASQPTIIHASVVNSQALTQYQQAIQQEQIAQQLAKQKAIQKIQDMLKAQQAAQAAQAKAIADAKAAAEAKEIADAKAAAKAAADAAAAQKAAQKAAQAAALKQSIEKQLKSSMEKQLAKPMPVSKPASTTPTTSKPATTVSPAATPSTANPDPGLSDKYKAMIIQAISEQWIVPQNLPKNIKCVLSVRVAPGGVVLQVTVTKSSGNPVLDNSAVAAVNKASPLPVPTDPNLFDAFRTLTLTVKPDGSLLES